MNATANGVYKVSGRPGKTGVFQFSGDLGGGNISFKYACKDSPADGDYKAFANADAITDATDEGIVFETACTNLAVVIAGATNPNVWFKVAFKDSDD